MSVDPLQKKYPGLTPYQYESNSPILNIDLDGLEGTTWWDRFLYDTVNTLMTGTSWNDLSNVADYADRNIVPTGIVLFNGSQLIVGKDLMTGESASRADAAGNLIIGGIFHQVGMRVAAPSAAVKLEKQMAENAAAGTNKPAASAHAIESTESNATDTRTASASSIVTTNGEPLNAVSNSTPNVVVQSSKGAQELASFKAKVQNAFKGIDQIHLDAAIKDMAGQPVVKHGKVWDHLDDITSHLRSLNRGIKQLNKMINNETFKGAVLEEATKLRSSLQKQYDSYSGALLRAANKYEKTINVKSSN